MSRLGKKKLANMLHDFGFYCILKLLFLTIPSFKVTIYIISGILVHVIGNFHIIDFAMNLFYIQKNGKDQIYSSTCGRRRSGSTSEARDHGCASTKGAS